MAHRRLLSIPFVFSLAVTLACRSVHAQPDSTGSSPLFDSDEPLELVLSANLDVLLADVGEDRIEHPALLSYMASDGSIQSQPVEVRTRGNYRRNPENCPFPPLRLDFKKSGVVGTVFQGLDKVKLVTHCRTEDFDYEQYVLLEYGLYRVYNLLTSRSFRVRLARLTYRDVAGRHPDLTRSAFLIEDEESVARRNGFQAVEQEGVQEGVPYEAVDFEQLTLLHLFQYMIGNIDWNVAMLQNVALIAPADDGPFAPVPYDFDLAGIIDPPGADRHPRLGPTALRHRLFSDYCGTEDEVNPALERFRSKRAAVYSLFENIPGLKPETVGAAHRYVDRFYRIIDDPAGVEREFHRPCRIRP